MRKFITLSLLLVIPVAQGDGFDELLQSVKQQSREELIQEDRRVKQFSTEKSNQQKRLQSAQAELEKLKEKSRQLNIQIDTNEKKLSETEAQLQRKMGDLGELFGAVRQVSGELTADFSHSIVSVQYPDRKQLLTRLAQSKELPDVTELEELWYLMLQEMGETGKTRVFDADVIDTEGSIASRKVTRVGAYALITDGNYLQHNKETNAVHLLQRQPPMRYSSTAQAFSGSGEAMPRLAIDPTHGQLFNLLTLKPTLMERIQQGGVIGYIILGLGVMGLLTALFRYFYLMIVSSRISRQMRNIAEPVDANPLGRIALVYADNKNRPLNERELALEEAMIKEVPGIQRYNGLIKLLAAVSPLLGLLGTVIGMIITFQAITLFGTSDPKLMAGGISTALVTTVLGLSVAIPLLFAYTFINARSQRIIDLIEHQSVGLITRE